MSGSPIDYRQFGQNLVDRVITTQRINDLIHQAIGDEVVLAHGLAKIRFNATSTVNRFEVLADKAPELWFALQVTVGFDIEGKLLIVLPDDYAGSIELSTDVHIQALDPLALFIDVTPFDDHTVKVRIDGKDLPAELTEGLVQQQLHDRLIENANKLLADTAARTFDLGPLVDRAVEQLGGAKR
jgi:hypothetical protein